MTNRSQYIGTGGSCKAFSNGRTVMLQMFSPDLSKEISIRAREILPPNFRYVLPDIRRVRIDEDGIWYRSKHLNVMPPIVDYLFGSDTQLTQNQLLIRLSKITDEEPYAVAIETINNLVEVTGSKFKSDIVKRNLAADENGNIVLLDIFASASDFNTVLRLFNNPETYHIPLGSTMPHPSKAPVRNGSPTRSGPAQIRPPIDPQEQKTLAAKRLSAILAKSRKLSDTGKWEELEQYADEKLEEFKRLFEILCERKLPQTDDEKSHILLCLMSVSEYTRHGYMADTGYVSGRDCGIHEIPAR